MEIEIKYAPVSYAQFVAIADDLGLTDEKIIRMSADYFDTANGFLSENKISLRHRTENDFSVYTMKCSLRNIGGVAVREEEEIVTDDINLAFDHFAKNPRLAEIVEKCRNSQLVPIASMNFIRKVYTHVIYGTTVEISHDIGKMYGKNGGAGELGHMTVEPTETVPCNCGKYGCLEQYASANGIVRMAKLMLDACDTPSALRDMEKFTSKEICDLARDGEPMALSIIDRFGEYMGRALSFVSCAVDPDVFIIGGGMSRAGDVIIEPIMKYYRKYAFHVSTNTTASIAMLSNDAGIYGCAKMVLG